VRDGPDLIGTPEGSSLALADAGGPAPDLDKLRATATYARSRLSVLLTTRQRLEEEAVGLTRILAESEDILALHGAADEPDEDAETGPLKVGDPPDKPAGERRYGKQVYRIFERVLRERGPQRIGDLYFELSHDLRRQLDEANATYSPLYRVRRLLKRNPMFCVKADGMVRLVHPEPRDDRAIAAHLTGVVVDAKGGPLGFRVKFADGAETVMNTRRMKKALVAGEHFILPKRRNRESRLVFFEGSFRAEHGGDHNQDLWAVKRLKPEDLSAELRARL
jgi:hypothetical protein